MIIHLIEVDKWLRWNHQRLKLTLWWFVLGPVSEYQISCKAESYRRRLVSILLPTIFMGFFVAVGFLSWGFGVLSQRLQSPADIEHLEPFPSDLPVVTLGWFWCHKRCL